MKKKRSRTRSPETARLAPAAIAVLVGYALGQGGAPTLSPAAAVSLVTRCRDDPTIVERLGQIHDRARRIDGPFTEPRDLNGL